MISEELLDKLNNSRVGNSIRLKNLELDDELIEKLTPKTYDAIKYLIEHGTMKK